MRNLKLINYSTLQNLIKHFDYCNAEHKNPNKDSQNLEFFSEILHNGVYLQKMLHSMELLRQISYQGRFSQLCSALIKKA